MRTLILVCLGMAVLDFGIGETGFAEEGKMKQEAYYKEATKADAPVDLFGDGKIRMIFRLDDIGFCHGVNQALEEILAAGGPVSAVSVMVTTPWLDEAVELLAKHPEISVGVHTCLNSEWTPYRWGPVLPVTEAPSLVDEWGTFPGTRKGFWERNPSLEEIDKELRAQIDLAKRKGLHLSYIDHHMSTAVETPEAQARFKQIADDYGLAISRWFGEASPVNIYSVTPEQKADALIEQIRAIEEPGLYLVVCHVGKNNPEMAAMVDLNPGGLKPMAVHREAEAHALSDPRLQQVLREKNIEVIGYDQLRERFLDRMKNPY